MRNVKNVLLGAWVFVTAALVVWVVLLNGRMWEVEKKLSWTHASVVVYLTPDNDVVACYQEMEWKRSRDE